MMDFAPGFHVQLWSRDGAETWRLYSGVRAAKQAFRDAVASGVYTNVALFKRITTNWTAEAEPAPALRLHAEWPTEGYVRRRNDLPRRRSAMGIRKTAPGAKSRKRAESATPAPSARPLQQRELFA